MTWDSKKEKEGHVCGDDWPVGDVKENWSTADRIILGDNIYTFHTRHDVRQTTSSSNQLIVLPLSNGEKILFVNWLYHEP